MQVARDDDGIERGQLQLDAGRFEVDRLDAHAEFEPLGLARRRSRAATSRSTAVTAKPAAASSSA